MKYRSSIRTLLVDDEPHARTRMRLLLEKDQDVEVVAECADGGAAIEAIAGGRIDLVFLDIQMPGLSGFDVIRTVGVDHMPAVVFATAFDEYAVKAFEACALDYLLKPFSDERFARATQRAKDYFGTRSAAEFGRRLAALLSDYKQPKDHRAGDGDASDGPPPDLIADSTCRRVPLSTPAGTVLIDPDEIDWIEARDAYVRIHVGGQSHLVRATMNAMESRFAPLGFARTHRSAIVNLGRVRQLRPQQHGDYLVVLQNGAQVRLSRTRRKAVEERLSRR